MYIKGRREGKSLMQVEFAKAAQKQGKDVLFITMDQTSTIVMLEKHGAVCEIIGKFYVKAKFKEVTSD